MPPVHGSQPAGAQHALPRRPPHALREPAPAHRRDRARYIQARGKFRRGVQGDGTGGKVEAGAEYGAIGAEEVAAAPQRDGSDDDEEDSDPYSGGSDDDGEDLGLTRFPSGASKPPRHPDPQPPDLVDDDYDEDDDEEPESPEEPDQATLEQLLKTQGNEDLANMYSGVKKCPCHRKTDKPDFERMWELPRQEGQREGVTRAVAQVWN